MRVETASFSVSMNTIGDICTERWDRCWGHRNLESSPLRNSANIPTATRQHHVSQFFQIIRVYTPVTILVLHLARVQGSGFGFRRLKAQK